MKEAIAEYFGNRTRRVTGLFIAGNLAFFLALLAAMFYLRWVSEEWPAMYSRFLNLWWIVLVFCLYFTNADLEGL
jgi:heme/copper-type cytochrome/quinol oxidase subunit 3